MKALVFDKKLHLTEIPKPIVKEGNVLIKILYSAICNTDLEIIKGYMNYKGVPGHEFVGKVVSKESQYYNKNVVGEINCACGDCDICKKNLRTHCPNRTTLGIYNHQGTFADYITLPEKNLHIIPDSIYLTDAVFTEPLAAALEIFKQIHIIPTEKVFIFGAGKLGLLIGHVFKVNGCDYSLFDISNNKIECAQTLGLNTRHIDSLSQNEKADIAVDCTGSNKGINLAMAHLLPGGKLILKTTVSNPIKIDLNQIVINEFSIIGSRCGPFEPAIKMLINNLIQFTPMISSIYNFKNILKAFKYAKRKDVLKVLIKH